MRIFSSTMQRNVKREPRILFVGEAVSLAHVSRPAVLARWATAEGYAVEFACGAAYAEVARGEGLNPLMIESIEPNDFYSRLGRGQFFYTAKELKAYVQAERTLIDRFRPDLVVGDFRLTLDISTSLCGVPLLSLSNAYWCPDVPCTFSAPQGGPLSLLPPFARKHVFDFVRPLATKYFAHALERVRHSFGLPVFGDFRRHYTAGAACAYLDLPELFPELISSVDRVSNEFEREGQRSALPAGHFFLGPVPWRPSVAGKSIVDHSSDDACAWRSFFQPENASERKRVYLSLGSSGDINILPQVLRGLAKRNCLMVLSGVNRSQETMLRAQVPELERRLYATSVLDPHLVLKRAHLTICHGGSGSIYQSLTAGVPVLCLPSNPDQTLASTKVAAQRAGMVLSADCVDGEAIENNLAALLDRSECQEGALRMAAAIKKWDSRSNWLKYLRSTVGMAGAARGKQSNALV